MTAIVQFEHGWRHFLAPRPTYISIAVPAITLRYNQVYLVWDYWELIGILPWRPLPSTIHWNCRIIIWVPDSTTQHSRRIAVRGLDWSMGWRVPEICKISCAWTFPSESEACLQSNELGLALIILLLEALGFKLRPEVWVPELVLGAASVRALSWCKQYLQQVWLSPELRLIVPPTLNMMPFSNLFFMGITSSPKEIADSGVIVELSHVGTCSSKLKPSGNSTMLAKGHQDSWSPTLDQITDSITLLQPSSRCSSLTCWVNAAFSPQAKFSGDSSLLIFESIVRWKGSLKPFALSYLWTFMLSTALRIHPNCTDRVAPQPEQKLQI